MSEPIRVLQVMASLDRAGAEAVVMGWLRSIDRTKVVFDFVVNEGGPYAFEKEAIELGCRIIPAPKFRGWNAGSYALWWGKILTDHPEWRIVHAHHTLPAVIFLSIAHRLGLVTIAHSHTAGRDKSLAGIVRTALRWPLRFIADIHFACSREAALWMFGRRASVRLMPNGIDTERFAFHPDSRLRVRREMGFAEELVVGHVGRFSAPKNHERMLKIFANLSKHEPRARLLLVGDGALRGRIEQDVRALGLEEKVTLAGVRADIPALLSAMDVFLFPSHFEGLGVALIEAQASGLRVAASDSVPSVAKVTDLVSFLPLSAPDTVWVDAIIASAQPSARASGAAEVRAAGYDSTDAAREIQTLYLGLQPSQES